MIECEYFTSLRDLVARMNDMQLTPKETIQILPAQGVTGYYLVYQKKQAKKNAE